MIGFNRSGPARHTAPFEGFDARRKLRNAGVAHMTAFGVDAPGNDVMNFFACGPASSCCSVMEALMRCDSEVPRVLFLGICLDFYFCLGRVLLPKFGFHLDRGSVSQALVKPCLVPP